MAGYTEVRPRGSGGRAMRLDLSVCTSSIPASCVSCRSRRHTEQGDSVLRRSRGSCNSVNWGVAVPSQCASSRQDHEDCLSAGCVPRLCERANCTPVGHRSTSTVGCHCQVLTWALCSRAENYNNLRRPDDGASAVAIGNPATAEFQVCRTTLLAGALDETCCTESSYACRSLLRRFVHLSSHLRTPPAQPAALDALHVWLRCTGRSGGWRALVT